VSVGSPGDPHANSGSAAATPIARGCGQQQRRPSAPAPASGSAADRQAQLMTAASSPRAVLPIQYLRAVAALMVVFHHARTPVRSLYSPWGDLTSGSRGVDIFFVISGFIMLTVARAEPPMEFAKRRAVRVVPMYWLATLLLVFVGPKFMGLEARPAGEILKSLFFVPYANPAYDGLLWPFLVPGWTLNYEVFFYAVFCLGLILKRVVLTCCSVIIALAVLGLLFHPEPVLPRFYTSFQLLEFAAGMLLGVAFQRWSLRGLWLLLPAGLLAVCFSDHFPFDRAEVLLLASTATVLGALSLDRSFSLPPIPILKLLGDASYSIYLTHLFALSFGYHLFGRIPLAGWPQFLAFMAFALVFSSAVGIAVHLVVELPVVRLLRRLTTPGAKAAVL
jgi:exopolysaccharide production protein ExoZ